MTDGTRLLAGRYELGELIGRGGMAEVHRGVDARLGRTVAIKLLKPALATDPAFRARFRKEAQAAARMAHPTVVRVFDAGEETVEEDGAERQQPFIVMELVEGRPLNQLLREGPIQPEEAVRIAEGVLTALEYSHRAGVVHRDIKPANIMVGPSGQVKVMDFGIARAVSDTAQNVAQTTAVLGTADYFSPEQARNEGVDARTDLYSMGIVLFEMLTGRPPFRGDSPVAVAYQHVSEPAVAPSSLEPAVTPELDAVVLAALVKDRFERFQTAAEFREQLQAAARGEMPAIAQPDPDAGLFGAAPEDDDSDQTLRRLQAGSDDAPRTQSRPPAVWIWSGIIGVMVVLAAVTVWVVNLAPVAIVDNLSVTVPDLSGMTEEQAIDELEGLDVGYESIGAYSDEVPEGSVISTSPPSGRNISRDQVVRLTVSEGVELVAIPTLVGSDQAGAEATLTELGLALGSVTEQNSATVAAGQVLTADPLPGTQVEAGTVVDLVISNGQVAVPDVVGQTVAAATQQLRSAELLLSVRPVPDPACGGGLVTRQSLAPGNQPQGSTIEIVYCTG